MAKTIRTLLPGANDYPASAPATPDVVNGETVLDFDAATDEAAIWTFVMPQEYGGGVLTLYPHFSMSSATTGSVVFTAEIEATADGESGTTDSFDTANSATIAVPATAGLIESSTGITLTNKDAVLAGEKVRVRLTRDANNVSDDAAGDCELHGAEIREA